MSVDFIAWPKTPRFQREVIVSEKLDGTSCAVIIDGPYPAETFEEAPEGTALVYAGCEPGTFGAAEWLVGAQSRNRLIQPGKTTDNFGFAGWVHDNAEALVHILGAGHHDGEWWGQGIARKYGMDHKRFSLFNADRYGPLIAIAATDGWTAVGLDVVPVLYRGLLEQGVLQSVLFRLSQLGSAAANGFDRPEGVIIFHTAARQNYKVLLEGDELPKSLAA